ncbi:MAG: twin-arginine translocase TatA/TatE family subunit [Proteobacteria bacterium]|nr:twin-arginine translocase TatA/TatE family subunit [Verrucomicrobiota bacterium]NBU10946.1 twin-arginine translocase TatA/TatE family subunit [Pseudomonadota bacterium]
MLGLSGGELILIAVVALVLFGANKIPTFMKGLGQGIKEFKKASGDVQNELERAMHEEPPRRPPAPPAAPAAPAAPASAPSQPAPAAKA